jgi:hypothetical protein
LIWFRIGTGEGALVNTVMNLWVPQTTWKFFSSWPTGRFPRRAQLHGVSIEQSCRLMRVRMTLKSRLTVTRKGGAKALAGLRKTKKSLRTVGEPVTA